MRTAKYAIYDWAGNLMNMGTFDSFDDAHEYLLSTMEHLNEDQVTEALEDYVIDRVRS